jgi:thiamine-phosphate pyrophosphorylase
VTGSPGPLPRLLVLTDRTQCRDPLPHTVAVAVDHGARAVVLREKDLPTAERAALAAALYALLAPVGGLLILAGPHPFPVTPDGWAAVQLAARDEVPRPRPALLGRSCHDAAEVARAAREGCDYVTVSPVFATASKPGYGPALGTAGLAALCVGAPPVYALAGIAPDRVAGCLAAGATGVAVMGAIMRDPTAVTAYLAALTEEPA